VAIVTNGTGVVWRPAVIRVTELMAGTQAQPMIRLRF